MRRVGIAIAMGALVAGTSAYAQDGPAITGVESFANTTVSPASRITLTDGPVFLSLPSLGSGDSLGGGAGSMSFPNSTYFAPSGNAMWDSFVTNNPDNGTITFESSNTAQGSFIAMESSSVVQIGIANGGGLDLHSEITPFGLGFYVADVGDGSCVLTGSCNQVAPFSPFTFESIGAAANSGFGEVGFEFTITTTGVPSGDDITVTRELYSLEGSLGLGYDGGLIIFDDLEGASEELNGFQRDTPLPTAGNPFYHSLGYSWNATSVDSGEIGLLDASFQTVTYTTRVWSRTGAPCQSGGGVTACLLAYSGFGDPIGAGDVVEFGDVGIFNHGPGDAITGLNFTPFTITAPRIVGGSLQVGGGAVPEPATWAMMIMGFGLLGSVLRRRRAFAHA